MAVMNDMARALHRYRSWGAEPEAFLCGHGAINSWDNATRDLVSGYVTRTDQRKHREFMGVPVILSRTAPAESIELVMRRTGAPATVEVVRP